ncbi:MAG TPA: serine hydrolase [Acetobacteraceae bacterium]|nr:serine hydrolase [Acetobacteraceae bacterium]
MMRRSRRAALGLIAGMSAMPLLFAAATPDDLAERLDAGIRSGLLRDVHAVLVSRAGEIVVERYYSGAHENWGSPLGIVTFGPDTLHDLRSVTKSIVGLLYGIALDRGLVPPPEAKLLAQFPQYPDLAADPQRARLTVLNALNMALGMEWDEARPYTDPNNSEIAMERAADRYRFILDRPFVATPGERWIYSGGAVALVGYLIAKGAGMALPDFARQALLAPLGISEFAWAHGSDGVASAASGLRLRPPDLLRIGRMVLAGGEWNGNRIVSRAWLDASLTPAIDTDQGVKYGRLWYIGDSDSRRWIAGFGNGGQRLYVMPDADVACVVFCGAYNRPDQSVTPNRIWREIVLPSLG